MPLAPAVHGGVHAASRNVPPSISDAANLARLALLAVAAAGAAVITGLLRKRMTDALARQRERHLTAERLPAALDRVDIGVVLLDADTRAEFINRAFRNTFLLSDAKADSKPPFVALMYHGRDTGAYEMPQDELSAFVAERMQMVRAGDQKFRSTSSSPTARCCVSAAPRCPMAGAC